MGESRSIKDLQAPCHPLFTPSNAKTGNNNKAKHHNLWTKASQTLIS